MKIIALGGKARSGKDSAGLMIKNSLEDRGYKVVIVHYADYLKYILAKYYDWDGQKDERGRKLLQYMGTDKVRNRDPGFWVNTVIKLIKTVLDGDFDYVVIPDTRFPNEIDGPKSDGLDTVGVRIYRTDFESNLTSEQKAHISETALDDYKFDYYINSPSGLDNLQVEVDKFIDTLLEEQH